jgi:uncharacterized protein YifE (UPF0438 family)
MNTETFEAPKKVAFAARKYSNENKLKREEEELERMVAEQKGQQPEQVEAEEAEPETAEERSFKKRYGDLRRHTQQREREDKDRIAQLEAQLREATTQEIKLPKSDEDIDAWAKKYPDVAAIVETIAIKKAREQSATFEQRVREIDEMKASAAKDKAEAELMQLHPDFDEIRNSDEFHEWVEEQPKWVQTALYENDNDAKSAARAIDLYKIDKNIKTSKSSNGREAAMSVNTRSRNKPVSNEASSYLKESTVQRMSAVEYERNADAIMDAIRAGKFIYDISGSAR